MVRMYCQAYSLLSHILFDLLPPFHFEEQSSVVTMDTLMSLWRMGLSDVHKTRNQASFSGIKSYLWNNRVLILDKDLELEMQVLFDKI